MFERKLQPTGSVVTGRCQLQAADVNLSAVGEGRCHYCVVYGRSVGRAACRRRPDAVGRFYVTAV